MMFSASQEDLYAIAFRAIEAYKAKNETAAAKRMYHVAWQCYELGMDFDPDADYDFNVHNEERISAHHPEFDAACQATKEQHAAFKAAKRAEYNAKRRLENAIRSLS